MSVGPSLGLTLPFTYGRGWPELIRMVNPAAGQPADLRVPGDRNRRPLVVQATLTTSAVVAGRVPLLRLLDPDGGEWARFSPDTTVGASTVAVVTWAVGVPAFTAVAGGQLVAPLPDVILTPGHRLRVDVDQVDAADQLSAVSVYCEQFPNGPEGYPAGPSGWPLPPIPE